MPGGPADALIYFVILVPLASIFQLANLAIFFSTMRRIRGWPLLRCALLWGAITACWVSFVVYSHFQMFRVVDPQYSQLLNAVGCASKCAPSS